MATRLEDGSILYAVYGTLRKGNGNNRLFENEFSEYLGTIKTEPKFTMYGKGAGFPYVAEDGTTAITVEVYKVTDDRVANRVNGLEGYTGERNNPRNWYDTVEIQTPWGIANMFTMNGIRDRKNSNFIIETGDWKDR